MIQKKNNKFVYIAAFALLAGGLGFLLFSGLSENSVYFLNVAEALAVEPVKLESARLFGKVDGDSVSDVTPGPGVKFKLIDKDDPAKSLWIEYRGAVPDTFKPGVEVIVEGGLPRGGQSFNAKTLMTKCPSKYQKAQNPGA
jgi:cytochrome c-type biogenesis protein CcmE